jgi:hypothetical protein
MHYLVYIRYLWGKHPLVLDGTWIWYTDTEYLNIGIGWYTDLLISSYFKIKMKLN